MTSIPDTSPFARRARIRQYGDMTSLRIFLLLLAGALVACGGDDSASDATVDATADATTDAMTGDGFTDATTGDAARDATADASGDAAMCTDYDVGRLCVHGTRTDSGEMLTADAPVRFMVMPNGCHSSACTMQEIASCTATVSDSAIQVEGRFCLRTEGDCTLPDCSGGGFAECMLADNLPDGDYTVTLGGLSVSFTIPSMIDFGGACDGTPSG